MVKHPELEGTLFEEIGTIVSAACLAHDMGNPPFGHSGEKAIQAFFREGKGEQLRGRISEELWNDLVHFEGNANAFRLLTHRFHGRREGGFVMTYATLASIVKYPHSSFCAGKKGKFGFFASEEAYYRRIAEDLGLRQLSAEGEPLRCARHPLVYLVEAADDICYEIMDIEDAHKLRILSFDETAQLLLGFFSEKEREHIYSRISEEGNHGQQREGGVYACLRHRQTGARVRPRLRGVGGGHTERHVRRFAHRPYHTVHTRRLPTLHDGEL